MAGYFEVISFLILFLLTKKTKNKKSAAELYYVIFTPAQGLAPVPTKLGEAKRANLISRFWRDSISLDFIFTTIFNRQI